MLLQLDIQNVALIEKISIEFESGMNILTGETGAGKSIIIDSINAVLGDRVSRDIIRTGSDKALIEAVFRTDTARLADVMNEMGMEAEEDGTVILSREITQSGRNTCRVNGKMVAASYMKTIGERLIDIHGQHDNQSLLKIENHIDLLDAFAGEAMQELRREYSELLEQYKKVRAGLKELSGDPGERERRMDLLRFQIDEIKKAGLKPNEEGELSAERQLLNNADKIAGSLERAYDLLISGEEEGRPARDALNEALTDLGMAARHDSGCDDMCKRLQDIIYQLEDLASDIRRKHENTEYDPARLEEIEERLDLIYKLKRKYGNGIDEIIKFRENAESKLDEIQKSEETARLLSERLEELEGKLYLTARKLNAERLKAASVLETRIGQQLDELEMKNAKFRVDIQFDAAAGGRTERKYGQNGLDRVEFLISPNAGEPLKPLAKIASGGEMSRVMLAIKTILAEVDSIPTMIFDEIDTGISGRAAQRVGEKLSLISRRHQVLCVTHQAQIACRADCNYLIEKNAEGQSTRTTVTKLDRDGRIREIARLIGGETTDTSLKYAAELIKTAKSQQMTR
jgi:DNA repair protein RecN (Recombination protein N)